MTSYQRLCRRYEQMKHMSLYERHKYHVFLKRLWYLLTREYELPKFPTPEEYQAYEAWCDHCRDLLGID